MAKSIDVTRASWVFLPILGCWGSESSSPISMNAEMSIPLEGLSGAAFLSSSVTPEVMRRV